MKKLIFFLTSAFLLFAGQASAQFTVNGIITDDSGQPLIGASVIVKGTTNGTVTDVDGSFTITIPDSTYILVISYTGFSTQEVKVSASKMTNIIMTSEASMLEEVVVTGLGVQRRKAITGSVSGVNITRGRKKDKGTISIRGYSSPAPPTKPYSENQPPFNTEDYDLIQENCFFEATQNPLSTFSIDVDAASYSNIRRFIQQQGQIPPKDAVRIEEMVNYFDYEYPQPQSEHPFEVITEISECPWQPQHRLVHIGLQGKKIATENLPASNLVFLIDVSGSMQDANKLPLVQASMKLLTDQLREQDRVAIVVYAGAAGLVLPPTSGKDKQKIKEAIDNLEAGGSTAGGAGIMLAYKTARENFVEGGNNRVILATDGDFNVGASSDADMVRLIEKERESGVFLTVLGYGMGNYKDNKMQQLADKGNGNHAYIDNMSEAKKVLVSEFGGTIFTIAKDVKIQIEFNPEKVQGYRLIGYENRMLNKEDFNDDKKDAGELGAGHTVTALYEIIPVGIKSEFLAKVDDLKYQKNESKIVNNSKELCTIKLRYKKPDGNKSQLIEEAVIDQNVQLDKTSDNFRWSAAVAEFGMLLRESEFKGEATYADCKKLAESAKGKDANGYRRELIDMVDTVQSLAQPHTAQKK
ncbi:MAG: von Willebrand factor type A domain-containing protein [Saprospiraceae bacterium]|nr:von Willebrand factor type A domain-containing protein [Saprospiraceae bacterium]